MFWRRRKCDHRWYRVGRERLIERTAIPNQPDYVKVQDVWYVAEICTECGAERVDRRPGYVTRVLHRDDARRLIAASGIPPGKPRSVA